MVNKKILMVLFALAFLFSISVVNGAVTVVNPVTATSYKGSITVNATYTNSSADITNYNTTNSTWYWNNAAITVSSVTCSPTACWGTWATTGVTDASAKTFNVTFGNQTAKVNSAAIASVTIDNTNPSCTSKIYSPYVEDRTSSKVECSCTDAIDTSVTVTRTLTKPSTSTLSITTSPYTITQSDLTQLGSYTFACSGVDDAGNSHTATSRTFKVETDDAGVSQIQLTTITSKNNALLFALISISIIAILIIVAVALTKKK